MYVHKIVYNMFIRSRPNTDRTTWMHNMRKQRIETLLNVLMMFVMKMGNRQREHLRPEPEWVEPIFYAYFLPNICSLSFICHHCRKYYRCSWVCTTKRFINVFTPDHFIFIYKSISFYVHRTDRRWRLKNEYTRTSRRMYYEWRTKVEATIWYTASTFTFVVIPSNLHTHRKYYSLHFFLSPQNWVHG